MSKEVELDYKKKDNIIVVYLHGNVDIYYSASFEKKVRILLSEESECHYIFNLQEVDYISSSGLGILLSTAVSLKNSNRYFSLCCLNNVILRIFEIVHLKDIFNIFITEDEAIKFLKSQ